MIHQEQAPTAIIVSALGLAGVGEIGVLDVLPKGVLMTLTLAMLSVVLFFVKRDYKRINDGMEAAAKLATELRDLVERHHNELLIELTDCVRVKDFGLTMDRVYGSINSVGKRVTVVETKMGLHDRAPADEEDPS